MTLDKAQKQLIEYYLDNKRDLPWRRTRDPYKILVSEIMLQQTVVSVVIPFFNRFIEAFPTAISLAAASEENVLSLWSGLGYYSRARNLQKAAREIAKRAAFPCRYEELLTLPGIGPYTAAAVASIAFEEPVAAVDGNVIRVLSRLFDVSNEVTSKGGRNKINELAQSFIHGQPPSLHNQALMELGATVCVPQNPTCLICPLASQCKALKAGTVAARPVKRSRRRQEPWLWTLYFSETKHGVALVKNENGTPWLKNTWVLPGEAKPWTKKNPPEHSFKHSITHHKIFVRMQKIAVHELRNKFQTSKLRWVKTDEIADFGISSVVHKALQQIK